jgi:hypothetical protein
MPRRVVIAVMAFGASALMLVIFGLVQILRSEETLLTDLAALLGIAEVIALGHVIQRKQWGRIAAMSMCLVQTLLGVLGLTAGFAIALPMIALAGFVVVPLSTEDAEEWFGATDDMSAT